MRRDLLAFALVVVAIIVQTTFFGRVRLGGIAPDIVMVAVAMMTLRLQPERALVVAFLAGVAFDALTTSAMGLRAIVYASVVFLAIRTKDRADFGAIGVAVWIGLLSLAGVALLVVIGTIFGQINLEVGEATRRILLVPLFNMVIGLALSPISNRLLAPARRGLM